MKSAVSVGFFAFLLAAAAALADDKDKGALDASKLVGTWKYVSGEKNGEKVDADRLKDQTVTITKETVTLKGQDTFVMKYTLDAKKKPATIKLTMTESPFGAGATAAGIVDVDGDTLKICYAQQGAAAPKKFEAKEGSNLHLFVLKRSK